MTARRIWIALGAMVGVVLVANLVAQGLDRAVGGSQPGGAVGSSYATAPDGLAAYAALLTRFGHDVHQQRGTFDDQDVPGNSTVFVLEPSDLTVNESAALLEFVTTGGRLVIGGSSPFYIHRLRDRPPTWEPGGDASWDLVDPVLGNVHTIASAATGSWSSVGSGRAVVGTDSFALLTSDTVGRGQILFLADASPLENAYLAAADNAAFGIALAGAPGAPVVFAEGVHGYGSSRGLAAIPVRWKVALVLLVLAALAFVWSRARRFGPPDRTARGLPPARVDYVHALSVNLERTRDPAGALAPVQRSARARVASGAGLDAHASDEQLAGAARAIGCTDAEIAALLAPVADDEHVIALGRALARVGGVDGTGRVDEGTP